MSVSNTHEDYDENKYKWERCRDVIEGRDAIVESCYKHNLFKGTLYSQSYRTNIYLPRLASQTDLEYRSYTERSSFFNATGRTLDALTGLIFAKDPTWKLPTAIDAFTSDITLSAINLREFSEQVVEQQIAVGRVGILVDYPANVPVTLTVATAEALNVRPFLRLYEAEDIINWRTSVINGADVLTLVVLKEEVYTLKDEFTVEEEELYRVLDLTAEGYRVRIMNDKNETISESFPLMRGAPMRYIPFAILNANSCGADVQKPPLLDLVDTNISHFRNSADYEHGLHFTGLPTPYVAGVQLEPGQALSVGSMSAWVFPDPSAKAEYLEFKGDGLKTLAEAMKGKEQRMAVLGARMLSDDKRTAEAFGTIELKTAGERSVLASIARSASDAMTRVLNWMAEWVGAPQDCQFALNTDYGATRMQPQMLTALVSAYQTDVLPLEVLFDNLQRGEIVSPNMEFEEYQAQLETQGPSFDAIPAPASDAANMDAQAQMTLMQSLRDKLGL